MSVNAVNNQANRVPPPAQAPAKAKPLTRYERFKARIKNITLVHAAGLVLVAIIIGGLSYAVYNYAGCAISPASCVLGL